MAKPTTAAPAAVVQAALLANEMATLCLSTDTRCMFTHGVLDDAAAVRAELDLLRDTINRLGWMADRTSELLGGDVAKGGAEAWLLSPVFNDMTKGGAA